MPRSSSKTSLAGRASLTADSGFAPQPLSEINSLLDFASEGIVLLDRKGLITDINAAALRLMHCVRDGIAGRGFWEAVPEAIAEAHEAEVVKAMSAADKHVFAAHHAFEDTWIEYTFRRHETGYVVNLKNVTASRKMQRLLVRTERHNQLIFHANPNAMWIFDAESRRILAANDAAVVFYGFTSRAFLKLPMGALFPDGEGASLMAALGPPAGPDDVTPVLQLCKQKKMSGEVVLVELACGRISWDDQKAVLVSLADVTERHLADRGLRRENAQMEETLEALKFELKTAQRDLAAFTYALSNDLQGPLHAANGFATMLLDKYGDALAGPGRHFINRIQASIRQLAKLVEDLRTLVQLPVVGRLEKVDLFNVTSGIIAELRQSDPGRVVTIEMNPELILKADSALVSTALSALLDNAWKFTGTRPEAWIRVELLPGETPDERVLQVSDNGIGFDADYGDRLFTAFQRLHSSADYPGNGLGLAIVKSVAERHGGWAWAKTDSNGASFFMSFPNGGAT